MGSKGIGIVSRRPLNEPSLLCLPEEPIFNFTAGIITIVDGEGLGHGTIGEDDKDIGVRVVALVRIVENHNGIIIATSELDKGAIFNMYFPAN